MATLSKLNRTPNIRIYYDQWFNIPSFMKYINSLPRGEVFRELGLVVRNYEHCWQQVIDHNDFLSVNKFVDLLKRFNIRKPDTIIKITKKQREMRYRPEAQMMEGIYAAANNIKNLGSFTNGLIQDTTPVIVRSEITAMKDNINQTFTKVSNLVDKFQDSCSFFTDSLQSKMVNFAIMLPEIGEWFMQFIIVVAKIMSLAYLLSKKENQNVQSILSIVTLALPLSVKGNQELVSGLLRAIQGVSSPMAQADENDYGFIQSFFSVGKNIFTGLFSTIDKTAVDSLSISTRKLKIISDYLKSATTITDFIMKLFEKIMVLIGDKMLKFYHYLPSWFKEDKFTALVTEYVSLKENRADLLCMKNHTAAVRVRRLYEKLMKYEADLNKKMHANKITYTRITPYLRTMVAAMEKIVVEIPEHLMNDQDINRKKPYWLYIHGEPRIGKSAMFQPFMINVLARALGYTKEYENYVNYTYFLNCKDEYREGYWGQWCTNVNDWLQNKGDQQSVQAALMDMTNMVDDNLYALNMAFASKGKVYFNSPLVVSNAQYDIIGQNFVIRECWSQATHLYARRNVVVEVRLNEFYRHPSGAGIDQKRRKAMLATPGVRKVGNLFPNDMYVLRFTDPVTGAVLHDYDFETGVQYIVDDAKEYFKDQDEFKSQLFTYFKNDLWEKYAPNTAIAQSDDENYSVDEGGLECLGCREFVQSSDVVQHERSCVAFARNQMEPVETLEETRALVTQYLPEESDNPIFLNSVLRPDSGLINLINLARNKQNVRGELIIAFQKVAQFVISKMKIFANAGKNCACNILQQLTTYLKDGMTVLGQSLISFHRNHPVIYSLLVMGTYISLFASIGAIRDYIQGRNGISNNIPDGASVTIGKDTYVSYNQGLLTQTEYDKITGAQTAEGSKKHQKIYRTRQVMAQEYGEQNVVIETKVKNQTAKIAVQLVKDGNILENVLFGTVLGIGGDIFVCPRHYYKRWEEMNDCAKNKQIKMYLNFLWGSDESRHQRVLFDDILSYELNYKHTQDTVYFRVVNMVQLSHLTHFFVSIDDEFLLVQTYLYGMRGMDFTPCMLNASRTHLISDFSYVHGARHDPVIGETFSAKEIHLPIAYKYYDVNTLAGDCGMMLVHCDNKTNCRKIVGMHIAGAPKHGLGYSAPIYTEDIKEVMDYFSKTKPVIKVAQSLENSTNEVSEKLEQLGFHVEGMKTTTRNLFTGEECKFKLTMPRKNKVQHSLVYDQMEKDFGKSTVAPSSLRPFLNDIGELVSPYFTNVVKMNRISNTIPNAECLQVVEHMYATIAEWETPYRDMFVLDLKQTVNGYGLLKAIDLSTSAGFPYVTFVKRKGKLDLFTQVDGEIIPCKEVLMELDDRIVKAKQSEIKDTYFIDTLKDETRDLNKVREGKTRIFQVAPVDFNLALRQYFGTFISMCHSTALTGEMAVGINANSYEWTLMLKQLLSTSHNFINGDGKNYDASVGQQYMMHVVEVINRLYNDGEENATIRRVLFSTFLNSYHLVGNVVYRVRQGNKSGIALTTIFNNLAGMFAIRLAYLRFNKSLDGFHRNVTCKFYGDDDLITVKRLEIQGLVFDSLYYRKVWKEMGVEYTSAHKDKELQPFSKLQEVTFLQRGFVLDDNFYVYLPQLNKTTVMEIARWSESEPDNMTDQMARFNATLLELANYGKEEFNAVWDRFVGYIWELQKMGYRISRLDLFTYDKCRQIIFPHLYNQM